MLRVGFVTCVQLGLSCMQAIYTAGGALQLAMTLPDDAAREKSGRVSLDTFCARYGVPLHKVRSINDPDAVDALVAARLDWLFIVGWSQLARAEVLTATRRGVLGIHPTLLPIGRGRAPIPWTILLGLRETGVTLFRLAPGVDNGPILGQCVVSIDARETSTTLYRKIDEAHATLVRESWPRLERDELVAREQDERHATYWAQRRPEDGRLSAAMHVEDADRLIRAVTHPYPGAFIEDESGGRIRIWQSGAPMEDRGGAVDRRILRLTFRNGWLDVTSWVKE